MRDIATRLLWQRHPDIRPINMKAMTSSSKKPEVHNLLQRRQKRIEPRPQMICTENVVEFRLVVLEICVCADRHTKDRQTRSSQYSAP